MKRATVILAALILSLTNLVHYAKADLKTSLSTLSQTLYQLNTRYVDTVDVDNLTEIAIKAMLKELDPHTNYLNAEELKQMREGLDGGFEGIGVSFRMYHDTIVVMHPTLGGPSAKVGIEPGDMIISCGDSILAGCKRSNEDIKKILRGPEGSIAHLGIKRNGYDEVQYFNVVRGKIPVYSAQTYYMATETIGYIHIERFSLTTYDEVNSAIEDLTAQGMEDLIIDLQGNGGGYLNAAVELSSMFIPPMNMVVYTEGRSDERHPFLSDFKSSRFKGKLVVLIDEQSASASEIFAGCIQDYDRGVIMGRRSFGKGLVQRPVELPNGGLIRLTVSHYYTPSGRCIQKPYTKGNESEYKSELSERYKHGELTSADSIHITDTVKYYTQAGRVVYGGGGILPDVFVPMDTTKLTVPHRNVLRKQSMNEVLLKHFCENHSSILMRFPTLDDFLDPESGYDLSDDVVTEVLDQARRDSVETEGLDSLLYNELFRTQVLAYMANNLYDNGAYSRIINPTSDCYLRAIDILNDNKRYTQILEAE